MSLDDFIITHFTRGAGINTLSTLIYSEVRRGIKPSMYALSSIIFATVLALLLITNFSPERSGKRSPKGEGRARSQGSAKEPKNPEAFRKGLLAAAAFAIVAAVSFTTYRILQAPALISFMCTTGCEYIDESVIEEFEEETGIEVVYDLFETNEEMYPVIEAGAVRYDVVCPSDYMIQKMAETAFWRRSTLTIFPTFRRSTPSIWSAQKVLIRKTSIPCPTPGAPWESFTTPSGSRN